MAQTRLNKVLRELNISIDRAVDFLESKGVQIEKSPNTKISEEVYAILSDEFQTDASKKVASLEVSEAKLKEKEELRVQRERELEEKAQKEAESRKVVKAKAELSGPKQVGKIELDKAEEELEAKVEEKASEPEKPAEVEQPKVETEKAKPKPAKKEVKAEEPQAEEPVEETLKTQYKKLSGPKIAGDKIDLSQFNKPKKKKEEKKTEKDTDNKKKRRRISKGPSAGGDARGGNRGGQKGFKKKRTIVKEEPSAEEVQKQVRETLEKLQGKSNKGKGAKYRREKRELHREQSEKELQAEAAESKILKVTEFVTASEVATMMNVSVTEIISACMSLGMMVTMNQRLDAETLSVVADEFGYEVDFVTADIEEAIEEEVDKPEDLEARAPIVTVMGHVDHGKTSLLDYIREENVIAGESGGITQHIGAYGVTLSSGQQITFLDTPGHEAFTAMRARGAQVTDLAIIVIAADDAVMPQTKEAIAHAQAAEVPIVFAINKIDKPGANPEKVKEELANMNLLVEDWGGKIQSHDISAKNGTGVKELLEKVLLEAELLELKANPDKKANGTVVEAFLDKGRGYVSTILVQAGTLKVGDYVLAGKNSGKVKAMHDERGNEVKAAGPSRPVSILGLDGAPQAGDKFNVFEDEREAKQIAAKRTQLQREQSVRTQRHITLDEIGRRIALGDFQELNIILKGDVDGSVEALTDSFQKLSTEEIQVNIIHKGVGAITESDVLLATASDAIIIGFNVRPMGNARQIADQEEIDIRTYSIIYDAINDLKDAMEGMLSPELKEEVTGTAEIRETFKISKIGTIAGCMVTNGKIFRNSGIRLIRDGVVIHTGELISLKRFKDDVKEVSKGYDCGMQLKGYNDIQIDDVLEAFQEVEVKKTLK
ncbi:translation initiation factor IF-2 [Psychroserpens sp.]|uniref:translation initiation factor IF-2 n=1 Tax=Psychroserpens sp. TaxID=2020870 RepID=UPI001B0823E7|nr:translation initiation factor IF-2 [Psychroserpens sp.]MBO6607817.1 translation initiation factor IF-2 [Psychroserpens sp.]MBO6630851.1 translation initiation factor IF-2 [Psychroserpens sp.]MBO6654808.1 translation initiation factor IF-2 [Psychroserpens sp.]MBO6682768.1 translation initiation factor IF-2 [Psychroserpens sp.]MBO6751175.1 translation initiation factor IF-2 [Psychroserpens sp.]